MDLGVLLFHRVRPARRGLKAGARQSEEPVAQISKAKGEEADEYFESSNNDRVLPRADGRSILTSRKGGRVEQKNHDDFQRACGDSGSPPQGVGGVAGRHLRVQNPGLAVRPPHRPDLQRGRNAVYATILAIPNYRLKATDKTVVTFRERPAGEPEALRAWFYPGRNWGEEFVYPKARAVELAKTTNTPVLFMAAEIPVEVEEPIKTADEPVVVQLKQAPIMAIKPTGEEVELAAVVTPPPAQELAADTAPTQTAAATLPTRRVRCR